MDVPVYTCPAISYRLVPHSLALCIGQLEGGQDIGLPKADGISIFVNCAINLDINLVRDLVTEADGDLCPSGYADIRD